MCFSNVVYLVFILFVLVTNLLRTRETMLLKTMEDDKDAAAPKISEPCATITPTMGVAVAHACVDDTSSQLRGGA